MFCLISQQRTKKNKWISCLCWYCTLLNTSSSSSGSSILNHISAQWITTCNINIYCVFLLGAEVENLASVLQKIFSFFSHKIFPKLPMKRGGEAGTPSASLLNMLLVSNQQVIL